MKTRQSQLKVITPSGTLNTNASVALRREITDVVSTGAQIILIDCKAVTLIDCSGLTALVIALKFIKKMGGKLSICSLNNQLQILFKLTEMEKVFEIFADRAEFEKAVFSN